MEFSVSAATRCIKHTHICSMCSLIQDHKDSMLELQRLRDNELIADIRLSALYYLLKMLHLWRIFLTAEVLRSSGNRFPHIYDSW